MAEERDIPNLYHNNTEVNNHYLHHTLYNQSEQLQSISDKQMLQEEINNQSAIGIYRNQVYYY